MEAQNTKFWNDRLVRFGGKFKDLIPNYGFKFNKLYARNYRVYSKQFENEHSDQQIWIWQHHSGYVEFIDLHNYSAMAIMSS